MLCKSNDGHAKIRDLGRFFDIYVLIEYIYEL